MKLRQFCFLLVASLAIVTLFCSTSSAQWRGAQQPGQKVLRYLGAGYGPGYHWRTPGHNSCYYNPYSAHNSFLISQQGPQDLNAPAGYGGYQQPGIPYSVYAPTTGASNFGTLPGAEINGTFQPVNPQTNDFPAPIPNSTDADSDDANSANEDTSNEASSNTINETRSLRSLNDSQIRATGYSPSSQSRPTRRADLSLDEPFAN